jgi:hypothetical protein
VATATREQLNGTAAVRTAVRTVEIALDGDYEGWSASMRINPPMRIMDELRSGDIPRYRAALAEVISAWNFVDDEGRPLPLPKDGIEWDALPFDLESRLVLAYGRAIEARSSIPKAQSTASAPSSSSDD